MTQCGHDAHGGVHAGKQIGHGHAHLLGATAQVIALACDAHQAANALYSVVISRAITVGAGLSKTCHAAINKARVKDFETAVVQAIAGHVAHFEILDEDIAVRHQFSNQGLALWLGDIARK